MTAPLIQYLEPIANSKPTTGKNRTYFMPLIETSSLLYLVFGPAPIVYKLN